tara:strand:+ start:12707 stop:13069 length:363 start_codon:yes stop_codon:yes gene_type:complete
MQIVLPNINTHTFKIIPRRPFVDKIKITDEDENISYIIADLTKISVTNDRYYIIVNAEFPLNSFSNSIFIEGRFYTIEFYYLDEAIYKDMAFCTSQNAYDYSINKDQYKEHESTNEYIVI